MSIQELETQLLNLDRSDRAHLLQVLEQSLQATPSDPAPPTQAVQNLADFFRNSPLAEAIASNELDLTRDKTIEPDRVAF